jgi:hypothetical protein
MLIYLHSGRGGGAVKVKFRVADVLSLTCNSSQAFRGASGNGVGRATARRRRQGASCSLDRARPLGTRAIVVAADSRLRKWDRCECDEDGEGEGELHRRMDVKLGEVEGKSVVIGNDNRGPRQDIYMCAPGPCQCFFSARSDCVCRYSNISDGRDRAGRRAVTGVLEVLHDGKQHTAADCAGCMLEGL